MSGANAKKFSECQSKKILVVDDEQAICKTLQEVFGEEGHQVFSAFSGKSALAFVELERPDVIFLDIWMPEMDGLETLREVLKIDKTIKVIMMSGHASIATAVEATRQGALDFLEKPFDLEALLSTLQKVCAAEQCAELQKRVDNSKVESIETINSVARVGDLLKLVFSKLALEGKLYPQRTLAQSTVIYGHGVHTGKKSGLVLEPLPENSGIHFLNIKHSVQPVPAHVTYVESTGYRTALRRDDTLVGTIEHLMSALHAFGVSNLLIKCNDEVPVLDGSALEFCKLIEEVGIKEQEAFIPAIKIDKKYRAGKGEEFIEIEPAEEFSIHYTLAYPEPVGLQVFEYTLTDIESYKKEIAPARTFGFVKDIGALQAKGLAQGGRFDNFVLIGEGGVINADLRFPNEAVRHKILDAIGDLYLLGRRIQGKVTARMTGHSDNIDLLNAIWKQM
jgi:UDP-3-O-[3-hydroxymyristoyl] N-acetylglucosamine deacetylase